MADKIASCLNIPKGISFDGSRNKFITRHKITGAWAAESSAGNLPSPRRELYYGLSDSSVGHHGPALRSGHWKLIVGTGGGSGDHPHWWRRYGVCVWQLGIC